MEDPPKHPEVALIFTRLLSELSLSGNQLARALSTSQQVISGYTSGRTNPGREMLAAIIRRYPAINAAWLATGEGEPFPAGRFNEKPGAVAEPLPAQQHDYTSGPGTVNTVVETLLRELLTNKDAVIASKDAVIELQAAELSELRGKPSDSSDAAGPTVAPTEPTPAPDGSAWRGVRQRTVGFAPRYLQAAELSE